MLEKVDIIAMDANSVPDVAIDVCYKDKPPQCYGNSHAAKLEATLGQAGLLDMHRELNGPTAQGFTRVTSTLATRIDRIYARTDIGLDWSFLKVNGIFGRRQWNPDHRALAASINSSPPPATPAERSIQRRTYDDLEAQTAVIPPQEMY